MREGIRASGAPSIAYKHLDMDDLERKLASSSAHIKIIVTDGVFSQHGDIVPLPDMMALAERYDAVVYIDDAHGTGVLGPNGAGTTEHFGIDSPRIITMGTLSKAYGCIGGFVATESYRGRSSARAARRLVSRRRFRPIRPRRCSRRSTW